MDTLYMNLFDSTASMGWINATIASVQAYGNVALVHTVEEIGERLMPQTSSISYVTKKPTPLAAGMVRVVHYIVRKVFILMKYFLVALISFSQLTSHVCLLCNFMSNRLSRGCWRQRYCGGATASGAS